MIGLFAAVFYIGCQSQGIATNGLMVADIDESTGKMELRQRLPVTNALYQALSPEKDVLYSCAVGGIASYAIEEGKLSPVGFLPLEDCSCLCHLSLSASGTTLVFAEYAAGKTGMVEVRDGKFGSPFIYSHKGKGPNQPRQDAAHCHQAVVTPDGARFVTVDLGTDSIVVYPIDVSMGKPTTFKTLPSGAGPRHLAYHPNGKLAVVLFELGNLVATYEWSARTGFGKLLDQTITLSTWPSGRPADGDLAAAIRFTPDGKRVVVSNRGEESLVTFNLDARTGKLNFLARSKLPGSWPRDFVFVNDKLAVVAMERSGEVHSLRYDSATGGFKVLSTLPGLPRPLAVLH